MPTLENITKGNFNLEFTKKTYKHEHNLRFHIKVDEHYYEYAMDTQQEELLTQLEITSLLLISYPYLPGLASVYGPPRSILPHFSW